MKEDQNPEPESPEKEQTPEEKEAEARADTKKIIVAAILIVASLGVVIGIRLFYDTTPDIEQYTYNGFTFTKQAGLWHTQWQRDNDLFTVRLRFGPRETEDIPLFAPEEGINVSDTIFLTFDPGEDLKYVALAASEISLNLHRVFNLTPTAACTSASDEACEKRPIVTCDSTDEAVIYLRHADEPALLLESNCITVQGPGEDLVRAADQLIWIQYGIIRP